MTTPFRIIASAALLLAAPAAAAAQHITLKTVPIPLGEQFQLLPSRNLGMANVHVAIDDPLLDPFTNPARGAAVDQLRIFALPTVYSETNSTLGGRSFPLAAVIPGRTVFGTFAFAMQQVDNPNRWGWVPWQGDQSVFQENSSSNIYAQGTIGARLGRSTSIGVSYYHADLDAVDAVNLLYGQSIAIDQDGSVGEAKFGLAHDLGGERRLDAVVLRSDVDMSHDVLYQEWNWVDNQPLIRSWNELNEDRTITWGAHLRYTQPLGDEGTRIGFIATGATKSHPKIPNYNIVNIPRDPGNSTAFNFGVGLSRITKATAYSMELIFEPGRSHTWAYADTALTTPGGVIQPGEKTVDNQFRYGNWNLAAGLQHETDRAGFQLGIRVHETRYSLEQHNFLADTIRNTDERWIEWSPSWGGVVKFGDFDLRYTGRFTAKGSPGNVVFTTGRPDVLMADAPRSGVDFVIGPTGPVSMPEFRVTMHRLMVSVPFGR
ncbi:MAG TPA: hypothetical protein VK912_01935 [Longimicrobiales bacterium]|nr:hypothetical protein [Longimicrobiales bacterium]